MGQEERAGAPEAPPEMEEELFPCEGESWNRCSREGLESPFTGDIPELSGHNPVPRTVG